MRITNVATLAAATVALVAIAGAAFAQTTTNPYNVSWAALNPGSDWSATVLNSLFPISGNNTAQSTGEEATVVGLLAAQFTGFVAAIACAFVSYNVIMNIHRAAESSQILGSGQSSMFVVRTGFAAIMMFPLTGNFSVGQQMVMQGAMWGAGMARVLYNNAITAVGPSAVVIATPMIPGTQTIVRGLINSELCMDLVNLASGTSNSGTLMPTPTAMTVNDGTGTGYGAGYVAYRYSLSTGNESGNPTCGTVTVREPGQNETTVAGVSVDMASVQAAVLNNVLNTIRPQVASVAQQLWQTKTIAPLANLQNVYTSGVQQYTSGLTAAATSIQSSVNSALSSNSATARAGALDVNNSATQQVAQGWTSAGAYYLEIARANAATLGLLTETPVVTPPTWDGLPQSLSYDLAPFEASAGAFMATLQTVVNASDGVNQPSGNLTPSGQQANQEGLSTLDQIIRALDLNGNSLNKIMSLFQQNNAQIWTDPFGGLMTLGQTLIIIALTGLGIAAIASSATLSTAATIWNVLTLNWGAAAVNVAGAAVMNFLATPVFILMMAIMIPGIIISYVLPMIPYVIWMAGVCGWIILVCEAMFAVPLWMLAHMTVGGDGLHGRAVEGWALLFNVVFRPSLMVIGLFLSYFVFDCMSWLIRESFGVAAGFVLDNGYIVTNWIGVIVLMHIFVMLNVTAALMSFRMVALLPHHLPRLIGFNAASRVDMENFYHQAGWVPGGQIAGAAHRQLVAGAGEYSEQAKRLAADRRRLAGPEGTGASGGSMDTTLRAVTDSGDDTRKSGSDGD
jgi:conjugal transfer/type IV secretion protein DotA/TraY